MKMQPSSSSSSRPSSTTLSTRSHKRVLSPNRGNTNNQHTKPPNDKGMKKLSNEYPSRQKKQSNITTAMVPMETTPTISASLQDRDQNVNARDRRRIASHPNHDHHGDKNSDNSSDDAVERNHVNGNEEKSPFETVMKDKLPQEGVPRVARCLFPPTERYRETCHNSSKSSDEWMEKIQREKINHWKEKWNFDVVSGQPLPGRYEWERVTSPSSPSSSPSSPSISPRFPSKT